MLFILILLFSNLHQQQNNIVKSLGKQNCIIIRSANSSLICWGSNKAGQLDIPTEYKTNTSFVGVGGQHTCAYNDKLHCWGQPMDAILIPQNQDSKIVRLSAGFDHNIVLKNIIHDKYSMKCFGIKDDGVCDIPQTVNESQILKVESGDGHSCVVRVNGKLICWGFDKWGQSSPDIKLKDNQMSISLGSFHTCSIGYDFMLNCFGLNSRGQLDIPEIFQTIRNKRISKKWSSVESGTSHNCGIQLQTNALYCWGWDESGQARVPAEVKEEAVAAVACGDWHTCAIQGRPTKGISCWGDNGQAQVDIPSDVNLLVHEVAVNFEEGSNDAGTDEDRDRSNEDEIVGQ